MLSKIQLQELESLGELQFPIKDCAIVLQIDINALQKEIYESQETKNTYERGRLKSAAAVRKSILEQAKNGSTPAQKQMLKLMSVVNNESKPPKQKNKMGI